MIDYIAILSRRYADKEWTLNGNEYTGLTWLSEGAKPSKKTLDDLWAEVQAEIATEAATKAEQKQAVLDRLGLSAAEVQLLLGA
jgi:hypothetical protein